MTAQQRDAEKSFLSRKLKDLEKALEKAVTATLEDAAESLDDQLFSNFPHAVQAAVQEATNTSNGWVCLNV